jgi:hypothetical protein
MYKGYSKSIQTSSTQGHGVSKCVLDCLDLVTLGTLDVAFLILLPPQIKNESVRIVVASELPRKWNKCALSFVKIYEKLAPIHMTCLKWLSDRIP